MLIVPRGRTLPCLAVLGQNLPLECESPAGCSGLAKKLCERLHRFDVRAENLESGQDWHGQDDANDPPHPPPENQRAASAHASSFLDAAKHSPAVYICNPSSEPDPVARRHPTKWLRFKEQASALG